MTNESGNRLTEELDPTSQYLSAAWAQEHLWKTKRNLIRQIIQSYHQRYDHFLEAMQNAIDACERLFKENFKESNGEPYKPEITIEIDIDNNKVRVTDNGEGMTIGQVKDYLFTPYASDKPDQESRQRGEKGVGNLFLSYGTPSYEFATRSADSGELSAGEIENGLDWTLNEGEAVDIPKIQPIDSDLPYGLKHGTTISFRFNERTNIPSLSECGTTTDHWDAILRLHTGAGFVDLGTEPDVFLDALTIQLYVTNEGTQTTSIIKSGYYYPHTVPNITSIQLRVLDRRDRGRLKPTQKMKSLLYDKYSYDEIEAVLEGRIDNSRNTTTAKNRLKRDLRKYKPKAYISFSWANQFWADTNKEIFGFDSEECGHGIAIATKSQRLADRRKIEFPFRTGDFNRFHIVLDMENVKSDIGRKSFDTGIARLANEIAAAYQRDFVNAADALRPAPKRHPEGTDVTLEKLMDDALHGTPHGRNDMAFINQPREEQDVVSLFFNLLGKGLLKGMYISRTFLSERYDAVGHFKLAKDSSVLYSQDNPLGIPEHEFVGDECASKERNWIEFKYSTDDLILDIEHEKKAVSEIDWLICWEKGSRHEDLGIDIDDITTPDQVNQRKWYGVTDLLTDSSGDTVAVIQLKKVLELIA